MSDHEVDIEHGAVPAALTDREQWVCWRTEQRDGNPTKIPVDPNTGGYASATDPTTWAGFETALDHLQATESVDGVGIVFTDDDSLVGVDLDDCRDAETGELNDEARAIVDRLDSYTEVSPSGTGIHVIVRGELPDGRNRRGSVELYDHARYFTVTGQRVDDDSGAVEERQDALVAIHREYVARESDSAAGPPEDAPASSTRVTESSGGVALSDDELLQRAQDARNGQKFAALWRGDTTGYDSHSEADMALCCLLAFWTGGDVQRIDRLFRESGLVREKWDEVHYADGATYGERTVERALAVTSERYDPEAITETTDDGAVKSTGEQGGDTSDERSRAYLFERNRLLRERVERLEADLDAATDSVETLQAEVASLEATLAEREATIEQLTERLEPAEESLWQRATRVVTSDASADRNTSE